MGNKLYNDFIDYVVDFGYNPTNMDYPKSVLNRFCKEKSIMSPKKFEEMFVDWFFKKS